MDFVRIELGGYRQEVVIGSLSIPEYQLALSDPPAFTERMGNCEYRPFHACDDVAHYSGIVANEWSEARVLAMRRDEKGVKEGRILWQGRAVELLRDTKVVRPRPYWCVPTEQRRYRAWFASTEKHAACDFDIQTSPDTFSIDGLAAEITWVYGSPVYTQLQYDGQAVDEVFVSSSGDWPLRWKVEQMDRRRLLAEEAKLERLGLLKHITAGSVPDYEEDEPGWSEESDTTAQCQVSDRRPYPVTA